MIRRKRRPWLKWMIALLLTAAMISGGVWYRKRGKENPPDFKTATITRGDLIQMVTANGQLNPVKSVQVGSQISGIINKLNVDFNSRVKEGEVIAQIDPATYEHGVTLAEAELMNAKASLELAQLNHRRAAELRKGDLIAASEADKTLADLHQTEAMVRMREASLQRAKVDLSRTTIYAPISGVVILRNVDVGQTVAASFSTPTLFQIAHDLSKMQIDAMVSEADVGGVEVQQKVNFTVDAFPSRQFEGEVRQVRYAPTTNQNVVTYTTVVDVDNPDLKLRPGMTATASIITAQRPNALIIPNGALRFRPPENALLQSPTNAPKPSLTSTNQGPRNQTQGAPGPQGNLAAAEGGGRPSADERRRRFESMTPEQRAAFRERMAGRFGEGGPGGPGPSGEGGRRRTEGPATRTVYVATKGTAANGKEVPLAKPVVIKTGITDGAQTEVLDGLKEGDVVIIGLNIVETPATAAAARPPVSPFGGGGFRPR